MYDKNELSQDEIAHFLCHIYHLSFPNIGLNTQISLVVNNLLKMGGGKWRVVVH